MFTTSDQQEIFNPDQQVAAGKLEPVVATGSSQAVQQMDSDLNQTPEKGQSNAVRTHTSEPSRKHELMSGILRIVPADADVRNPDKPDNSSMQSRWHDMLTVLFAG